MVDVSRFSNFCLLVLVAGFSTSYATYFLRGRWEFAGLSELNPLSPVELQDYARLTIHTVLTSLWMLGAFYNLKTQGTGNHAWVGRGAILIGFVMWSFAPASQQISSCWPVKNFLTSDLISADRDTVAGLIAAYILNLILGWIAISQRNRSDHILFMCHAIWASLSPALMRIVLFPGILYFSLNRPSSQGTLLTIGQWLLLKETTYLILSILFTPLYFYPDWSPYARVALGRANSGPLLRFIAIVFLVFLGYRFLEGVHRWWSYWATIGFAGGQACEIYLEKHDFLKFWSTVNPLL